MKFTISEEIVESVIRPVSLFLNDVPKGAIFTHDGKEVTMQNPSFRYSSSAGGMFKFTIYDLQKFKNQDGIEFSNFFTPRVGDEVLLRTQFTIVACVHYLDQKGAKVYPGFCYKGYSAYLADKIAAEEAGNKLGFDDYQKLRDSGLLADMKDKYYRTVQIDADILYVPKVD